MAFSMHVVWFASQIAATQLFAARARLAAGGAHVSDEHVRGLCTRPDGLPLAIELAASQLRVREADDIVARLDRQLTFRGPGSATALRQRTLDRGAHCVAVILAQEDDRQLPQRREVHRFVKFALGHRAVAEVTHDHLIAAAVNDAVRRIETTTQEKMAGVTAGLPLPPGLKLPF